MKNNSKLFGTALILFCAFVLFNSFKKPVTERELPDFKLKNVDGKMISMADYKTAKGFIIVFTCNHCPFAKMYQDRVIALSNEFASKGFPLIAINSNDVTQVEDDSYANMIVRAKEKNFPFPYLYDETQSVVKIFGATKTPEVYLLVKSGDKYILKYTGAIDDNDEEPLKATHHYVAEAITEISSGLDVSIPSTKAIGCSIKMKK
jgi:glutathione peroxidase-family protein